MEAAEAAFDAAAAELMLNYDVKLSKLHERLRTITEDASKDLPPLKVLYNVGGVAYDYSDRGLYDFSEEFKSFIRAKKDSPSALRSSADFHSDSSSNFDASPHPHSDSRAVSRSTEAFDNYDSSLGPYGWEITNEDRIRHEQCIVPFGHHVMKKWPEIAKLVKLYMENSLGHLMSDIEMIALDQKSLDKSLGISNAIAAATGQADGETDYFFSLLKETDDYIVYAPSALNAMRVKLDSTQSELICAIQEKRDALLMHMPYTLYTAMLQSHDAKFLEEKVKEDSKKAYEALEFQIYLSKVSLAETLDKKSRREKLKEASDELYSDAFSRERANMDPFRSGSLSFTEAIEQYGERHYVVWKCQKFFNEKAMRFLLLHPEFTEQLASQEDNVDYLQTLGLCAASNNVCCKLGIAEVPCRVEWAVSNHKGRETVRVV